jgi:hypothetical protein
MLEHVNIWWFYLWNIYQSANYIIYGISLQCLSWEAMFIAE